jgi:hypothetical protein
MNHILNWKLFESNQEGLTPRQEYFLNRYVRGKWRLNSEGLVDVSGYFDCIAQGIESFNGIKFGYVTGDFRCGHNKLESLIGSPKEVGGNLDCPNNNMISLEGSPQKVDGWFSCHDNSLSSLEGGPIEIGTSYYCMNNPLTSLKGAPVKIVGKFFCDEFQTPVGKWGIHSWTQAVVDGSKLALTLFENSEGSRKKITDLANLELKKKGNFENWEWIFKLSWYKPTPFVDALYKTWKKGL